MYMNETVDISQAVSWPAFQICWCSQRNYDCDPPDQEIDIEGNMFDYYIDPAKFNYGTYYRWDGSWHRGENSVAFSVIPGTRPIPSVAANKTVTSESDETEVKTSTITSSALLQFNFARSPYDSKAHSQNLLRLASEAI